MQNETFMHVAVHSGEPFWPMGLWCLVFRMVTLFMENAVGLRMPGAQNQSAQDQGT